MSGATYDDPLVFNMSAASGTAEIPEVAGADIVYVRVTGIPLNRMNTIVLGSGDTNATAFAAYDATYTPENYRIGYQGALLGTGHDVIMKVILNFAGSFSWTWTSVQWADRPYTWNSPDVINPAGGTKTYDALHYSDDYPYAAIGGNNRFYRLNPTTNATITVTSNEPNGSWEVYHEDGSAFDEWVAYGNSDGSGAASPALTFDPIPGEEYMLVVYPTGNPDDTTSYTLTWSTEGTTSSPYVVANNDWTAPVTESLTAASGQFAYDNTGATQDASPRAGLRSIWYLLQLTAGHYYKLSPTPSSSDAGAEPRLQIFSASGEDPGYITQGSLAGGGVAFQAVDASYLLQVSFPSSTSSSPWDAAGQIAWQRIDIANGDPSGATALTAGAGQQTAVVNPIVGYRSPLWYSITAPRAGALSLVLEIPTGLVEPLDINAALYAPDGVTFDAEIPHRPVGTTTPGALIRWVTAGQVLKIRVTTSLTGTTLRWGMDTSGTTGPLLPARFSDNSEDPAALHTKVWPVSTTDEYFMFDFETDDFDYQWYSFADEREDGPPEVDTLPLGGLFSASMNGNFNAVRQTVPQGLNQHITGSSLVGVTSDQGNFRYNKAEFSHTITSGAISAKESPDPNLLEARSQPNSKLNAEPVYAAATRRWGVRKGYWASDPTIAENDLGDIIPLTIPSPDAWLQDHLDLFQITWVDDNNPTNIPTYDLFRTSYFTWNKIVQGSTIGLSDNPVYYPDDYVNGSIHLLPNDFSSKVQNGDNAPQWLQPAEIAACDRVAYFSGGDAGSGIECNYQFYDAIADGSASAQCQEDALIAYDIFGGQAPETTGWSQRWTYGLSTDLTETFGSAISYIYWHDELKNMHPVFSDLDGHVWPDGVYDASAGVAMNLGRRYPDSYQVTIFSENLDALPTFVPQLPVLTDGGGALSVADAGEYSYEGDVGDFGTHPILWFLYKTWGFLGDSIVAYGQGLGDTKLELHGVLHLGPGPAFPVAGDVAPAVTEWKLNASSIHAYDGTGVIFPGTAIAPPVVDAEVQTVEFVVPNGISLNGPTEFHVYVTNDNGRSNGLPLMLYPMVDINMQSADPMLLTMTAAMGVFSQPDEDVLEQRYSRLVVPYVLTGSVPERAPLFHTDCAPHFSLSGGVDSQGLNDPVDVSLPMTLRYRPLNSSVAGYTWNSNESSGQDLVFGAGAPFVDPDNTISSRNGPLIRPAMVFPGDAWVETTTAFSTGPAFTLAMAVTLYGDPQPRSYVLSSFGASGYGLSLYLEGDELSLVIGAKQQVVRVAPGYIGQRPIIIALAMDSMNVRSAIVSDRVTMQSIAHPAMSASGMRMYFGRSSNNADQQIATMDVLDLALDSGTASADRLWTVINRLDGIYGVMK